MFCTNCGAQNADSARFCTACGAALAPQNPSQKKKPTAVLILVVVLLVCGGLFAAWRVGAFGASSAASQSVADDVNVALTWQEQYELGLRYVSEGNYKEAIIAFTAAIAIEPKQPAPYLSLADAYLLTDNFEAAVDILAQGYAATQDESIAARQAELGVGGEAESDDPKELSVEGVLARGAENQDAMLSADEVTLYGQSVWGMNIETVRSLLEGNGLPVSDNSADTEADYWYVSGGWGLPTLDKYPDEISALQNYDDDTTALFYDWRPGEPAIAEHISVGVRDIKLGDSLASVYTALGFTNSEEFIAYWQGLAQKLATGEVTSDSIFYIHSAFEAENETSFSISTYTMSSDDVEYEQISTFQLDVTFEGALEYQSVSFTFESGGFDVPFDPTTAILTDVYVSQN